MELDTGVAALHMSRNTCPKVALQRYMQGTSPNIHFRASSSDMGADSSSSVPGLQTHAHMPCMMCWGNGIYCLFVIGYRTSD